MAIQRWCRMRRGKIKSVDVIPVKFKSTNWDQSTVVVKITDENGMIGIGECDGPTEVIEAFFSMETAHLWSKNPKDVLLGRDPVEIKAIWKDLYEGLLWQGRRGVAMFVIAGIDMALYDLAGKQLGLPAYKLLGGNTKAAAVPYATLYPASSGVASLDVLFQEFVELFKRSKQLGIKAVKLAIMPGEPVSDESLIQFIKKCRHSLGYDTELMVDFLYRWTDPYDVIHALHALEDVKLYFAEAVLPHDDLDSHRLVIEKTKVRICGAEMATSFHEVKEWIEKSKVAIVQPDLNRCGGITELIRIAEYCNAHGVQVIPHGWKTGITAASGTHFHLVTPNAKYYEYLHPDLYESPMRASLVQPDFIISNGEILPPTLPGLGVTLNQSFLEECDITGVKNECL